MGKKRKIKLNYRNRIIIDEWRNKSEREKIEILLRTNIFSNEITEITLHWFAFSRKYKKTFIHSSGKHNFLYISF